MSSCWSIWSNSKPVRREVVKERQEDFDYEPEQKRTVREKPVRREVEEEPEEDFEDSEVEEEDMVEKRPVRRTSSHSRIVRDNPRQERKPRGTTRRTVGRVSRRSSREDEDSGSGLDSLNAEMQKILKNSNRR